MNYSIKLVGLSLLTISAYCLICLTQPIQAAPQQLKDNLTAPNQIIKEPVNPELGPIQPNTTSSTLNPDAIAVRVFDNSQNLSPHDWYRQNIKANRSLQSLIVDGYDAIRDDRTVYVAAANVEPCGQFNAGKDCLKSIMVIISFNQNISSKTIDIFGQILNNWRFNQNINHYGGTCSAGPGHSSGINCLSGKDCPTGQYCNNLKSKLVRDTKRIINLTAIKTKLEQYRQTYQYYPNLEAGTYLTNRTLSVWPSWQRALAIKLNWALPIDPINLLGECPSGYNATTCWNEQQRAFATTWPDLPTGSRAYQYEFINSTNYRLCANFETSYQNLTSLACTGGSENNGPVIYCPLMRGLAKKPFTRYLSIYDNEGDAIHPLIEINQQNLTGWQPLSIELVNDRQQIKINSSETGGTGRYSFSITAKDSQGATTTQQCSVVIGNGLCGNDILDSGEDCDSINDIANNPDESSPYRQYACGDTCQFAGGWCGDGQIKPEYGENCDCGDDSKSCAWALASGDKVSAENNQYYCQDCQQVGGWCGDGTQTEHESCEAGFLYTQPEWSQSGTNNQYACSATTCQTIGGYCGDNIVQSIYGEQCEANNYTAPTPANSSPTNRYQCSASTCQTTGGYCGDNVVESIYGEKCEVNNYTAPTPANSSPTNRYQCSASTCQTTGGYCGDDIVQSIYGEQCEANNYTAPTPANSSSTNRYECSTGTCQTIGGYCGDGVVDLNYDENCDPTEDIEAFKARTNNHWVDPSYYADFQSACSAQSCQVFCFDNDNDNYGISPYNNCTNPEIDCDDRPNGNDGLANTFDDGKNINPGQLDDCTQYDGIDNNCDGLIDNNAILGDDILFDNFSRSTLEPAVETNNDYARTILDNNSAKLSQTYNSNYFWPNICNNLNRNTAPCLNYGTKSLTGLTWLLNATMRSQLQLNQNYLITFNYKGLANFVHPTTTTVISGQTINPNNQISWMLGGNTLSSPSSFVTSSSNLIKPYINYDEYAMYYGNFKYSSTLSSVGNLHFSILIGQNNLINNLGSINIDDVAITKCQNKRPDGTYCGDGEIQTEWGEDCETGNNTGIPTPYQSSLNNRYGCSSECKRTIGGYCGDGTTDGFYGELCDRYNAAQTHETNSINQYLCTMSGIDRCASTTGGWCGDGQVQTSVRDLYGWQQRERCDHNSNPSYSTTKAWSNQWNQYQCTLGYNCQTDGGWCGDGFIQPTYGEVWDCGQNKKCCIYNDYRWTNCEKDYSFCGDGTYNSCFEQCDYSGYTTPQPINSSNNNNKKYACSNNCQSIGGYCGDGNLQDGNFWTPGNTTPDPSTGEGFNYGEFCDYNATSPNWSTSTQVCAQGCVIQNIVAPVIEWVNVPGNQTIGTDDFQVMAQKARILGHNSSSNIDCTDTNNNCIITTIENELATSTPYYLTREKAQNACLAIGARLINNDEWMTIIKNGENIAANWSNGIIGSGEINSSLILSNGETVKGLASGGQEHLSNILQNTDLPTHPNQWQNQWLSYNQLEAGGSLGVLGSDRLLPGHSGEGYGKIKLPSNPSYSYLYSLNRSYYSGDGGGILSLEFKINGYNERFRCVKD